MKSSVGEERRKLQGGMALVTLQRSPSVAGSPPQCGSDGENEDDEGTKNDKSECFFAGKGTALGLTLKDTPKYIERRPSTDSVKSTNSTQSNNSDIQQHLQSMIDLLRPEETLKMAVKLESQRPNRTRYLVIVSRCCYRPVTTDRKSKIMRHNSAKGNSTAASTNTAKTMRQLSAVESSHRSSPQNQSQTESSSEDSETQEKRLSTASMTISPNARHIIKSDAEKCSASGDNIACEDGVEESCLLGIDCNERTTIGLVLPILADTTIHLDGDGGFSVSVYGKTHIFKPVSVQAMWSALQTLHKVSQKARENNFYPRGPSHDWTIFYDSRIESEQSCLNEWNAMDSLESRRPPSPDAIRNKPTAKEETESVIKMKLKEIMMSVDLDEVTSKYIRGRLEELLDMDLGEFKSFIDAEMLTILGQMDAPTEIFEHVYLGSEWNASNLEELQKNGIRHILNVTREIDNFFPGVFDYCNVRVYDDEKTNLLKHWDNTFRYITRAKSEGSKVLVHCKMGVSRSASVVIAYAMKAYNWEFKEALQHVKDRRSCIKPNKNFLNQLETYRGMLDAMKNKEKLQRSKSETNLKSTKDARLLPGSEPTPLIQALNQSKSKSTGHGVSGDGVRNDARELSSGMANASNTNDQKQRRFVRRSSSTSPKGVPHGHIAIVMKQQSQSLENLTPERSVADEPKNMRFPGSNGENYSVTQNQVRHIQTQPPPPPPPPPQPLTVQQKHNQQQASSVRTIVQDLETHKDTRKTADDRKSLNLQFGRSISHDTGTRSEMMCSGDDSATILSNTGGCGKSDQGSPVWTSSAKLITQTSNLKVLTGAGGKESDKHAKLVSARQSRVRRDTGESSYGSSDLFSAQVDNVFAKEEKRHSRKTHSWAAAGSDNSSGKGIVIDRLNILGNSTHGVGSGSSKLGSNSSIDSISSSATTASTSAAYEEHVITRPRQRDLPSRHASWGSGDNRCSVPMRNSSWGSYDTNRNTFQYGGGAILEGQIHELSKSNKTATTPTYHTKQKLAEAGHGKCATVSSPRQYQHVGTVKRTKQKLEQCTTNMQKKLCQENGEAEAAVSNICVSPAKVSSAHGSSSAIAAHKGRGSCLFRSASAAGSMRTRYPYRCNSEEIVPCIVTGSGNSMMPVAMRRSDGSRPLQSELFSASAPESYTMSDIENKNTLPAEETSGDDEAVVMRNSNAPLLLQSGGGVASNADQRISGTVQILKKNFEAKAGSSGGTSSGGTAIGVGGSGNVLQVQAATTKKGHHSLPSSPVAQHMDQSTSLTANATTATSPQTLSNLDGGAAHATTVKATVCSCTSSTSTSTTTASSSSASSSSSSSSSSSVCEPCDRIVKDLVHKYQATTTAATSIVASTTVCAATSSAADGANIGTSASGYGSTGSGALPSTSFSTFKPRRHSYYDSGSAHKSYGDGRPPPAPAKNVTTTATTAVTSVKLESSAAHAPVMADSAPHQPSQQQQQQQQHRRLQQHGRTHPLSRLTLPKHSFNTAAYNTM